MRTFEENISRCGVCLMMAGIVLMLTMLLLSACHDEHNDYYTTAIVTIDLPEGYSIKQMQGTVTLTNLNNRQTFSTSTFSGTSATLEIMRGVYSAEVEGSLRYISSDGEVHSSNFRAATSHCELLQHPSELHLDIILL